MADVHPSELGDSPTVEVRVYREGALLQQELCGSEEEALAVVEAWSEHEGVECEVEDLSSRHRADQISEPEPADVSPEDTYPSGVEDRRAVW